MLAERSPLVTPELTHCRITSAELDEEVHAGNILSPRCITSDGGLFVSLCLYKVMKEVKLTGTRSSSCLTFQPSNFQGRHVNTIKQSEASFLKMN